MESKGHNPRCSGKEYFHRDRTKLRAKKVFQRENDPLGIALDSEESRQVYRAKLASKHILKAKESKAKRNKSAYALKKNFEYYVEFRDLAIEMRKINLKDLDLDTLVALAEVEKRAKEIAYEMIELAFEQHFLERHLQGLNSLGWVLDEQGEAVYRPEGLDTYDEELAELERIGEEGLRARLEREKKAEAKRKKRNARERQRRADKKALRLASQQTPSSSSSGGNQSIAD